MRRWVPAVTALCILWLSGCADERRSCKPSPPAEAVVAVDGLQPETAMIRTCRNDVCSEFSALAKTHRSMFVNFWRPVVKIASEADLPATLRLDVAVNGQITQTYEISDLTLGKPYSKKCDLYQSVVLLPAPDHKLTIISRY
jgi:hypothetical protein